jgi:hypothetical protein
MYRAFDDAVREHDAQLVALGLEVWVGSEPTFADRGPESPAWLHPAPDGGAYPGLPQDLDDAAQRRLDRITVEATDPRVPDFVREAPTETLTPWHLDLRRL